jgi:hypothetical protein
MVGLLSKEDSWGILKIANVDVTNIKRQVLKFYNEWLLDTSRQQSFTTHENTFMYELIKFDYSWRPGLTKVSTAINSLEPGAQLELEKIYKLIEEYVDGAVVHAEIISMKPKSRIRVHKDRGDMLYIVRRFHIPLKTNMLTFFTVDEEQFFLQEGFLYELNNIKYHGVRNNSDEYRIHLIVDVLPKEYVSDVGFK